MANKIIPDTDPLTNAVVMEKVLGLYNDVVKSFGKEVKVIDLAVLMPKNSIYYYDFMHFTNAGCSKIASLISSQLIRYLKTNN
jgi:hypothetical protein